MNRVRRAVFSCHAKDRIAEFARRLAGFGVEILSTGGTARHLRAAGIAVRAIEDLTGAPEILDGRVKTLHPRVHAGILFRRDHTADVETMSRLGCEPIDMVVVHLYPFQDVVARPGVSEADAVENIDIGGPTMLRAAAKNFRWVTAVVRPERYDEVLASMESRGGEVAPALRRELATEGFETISAYDRAIAAWLVSSGEGAR